jgi:hypothetical protein
VFLGGCVGLFDGLLFGLGTFGVLGVLGAIAVAVFIGGGFDICSCFISSSCKAVSINVSACTHLSIVLLTKGVCRSKILSTKG